VWATNVPDAFTAATADATLGLLLCLARRLAEADRYVRSGRWEEDGFRPGAWDGLLLAGKTLGVVGYGAIGQAVARRARAFDMPVIYHRRRQSADPDHRPLDALLAESDVVSLHVPLTDQTRHLINAARLQQMKRGALLVNMARGPVVDEAALAAALESGHLAGAALDVFEHEPRVTPALLGMPQVVLAPHLGGGTTESRSWARLTCARNVAAILQGRQPPDAVNRPGKR
jgi:glyoxylate reductase